MENPVPLSGFIQIAIVVNSIESALDSWCELLGVERPAVRFTDATPNPNESYRGGIAAYALKLAVIDCKERGFVIELHETDSNPSTFREFLDHHGEGVHHIGFEVGDARDAIIDELGQSGYEMRTIGKYSDGSWTIVDSEKRLGVNLNIKPHA